MDSFSYSIAEENKSTEIWIGKFLLAEFVAKVAEEKPSGIVMITEEKLSPLWADSFRSAFFQYRIPVLFLTVPTGETGKSRAMKEILEDRMLEAGVDRSYLVCAVGGGMVCDLAAFTASTYMRGLPFVLVPTTTLAMADAAIGGKCAVNTPYGKNSIGAFALPARVVIDLCTLSTLPDREYRSGLVEMLKLGFVKEPKILNFFSEKGRELLARDMDQLEALIRLSVQTKIDMITEDFRDLGGKRALLNYGHTYGHAVETVSEFSFLHGEAVALGIRMAAARATRLGKASEAWEKEQNRYLDLLGMPFRNELAFSEDELLEAAAHDKKSVNHNLKFVLSKGPGEGIF